MKYFTVSALIISIHYLQCNAINFPEDQNSGCDNSEECRTVSDCPKVVQEFRENGIKPKFCSIRSSFVCCKKEKSREVTPPPSSSSQECGIRPLDFSPFLFLVGGKDTIQNSYPWMAALGLTIEKPFKKEHTWFCGGSYIGGNMILTAAHCVTDSRFPLDIVRLGAHDLSNDEEESADDYQIEEIHVHPSYVKAPFYDIAIIVLKTEDSGIKENPNVSPICLPSPGSTDLLASTGNYVTVAGWGATRTGGKGVDILQEVHVTVSNKTRCNQVYSDLGGIDLDSSIMCAGHDQGGRDACQGDSGGGLFAQDEDTLIWTQVGVVSAGIGCGVKDIPGLYTRVESYLDWIEETIQKQQMESSQINFV